MGGIGAKGPSWRVRGPEPAVWSLASSWDAENVGIMIDLQVRRAPIDSCTPFSDSDCSRVSRSVSLSLSPDTIPSAHRL